MLPAHNVFSSRGELLSQDVMGAAPMGSTVDRGRQVTDSGFLYASNHLTVALGAVFKDVSKVLSSTTLVQASIKNV